MKEIYVASWDEFAKHITALKDRQRRDQRLQPDLLFRGQAASSWKLNTTLERANQSDLFFSDYYRTILTIQPEIEAFTNHKWDCPSYLRMRAAAEKYEFFALNKDLHTTVYGYMAHLRHQGFPSPLLDWTRSEYVAAYFAFANATYDDQVAIYVMSRSTSTSGSSDEPQIHILGRTVRTHRRHFLQQCEYSLCAILSDGQWKFMRHELANTEMDKEEDLLFNLSIVKFILPASERIRVLKMLDQHNLNAFSLFGSEESLMETLSLRKFQFTQTEDWTFSDLPELLPHLNPEK